MRLRRRRVIPEVTPIVPVPLGRPFDDPTYFFEPKYDGFRGLLYVLAATVRDDQSTVARSRR